VGAVISAPSAPTTRPDIEIFATCPPSKGYSSDAYLAHVADVVRWSEDAGYRGVLVYTDNGLVDPWAMAQTIFESTVSLCPLVAVQPLYMHPYAVAKIVTSLAFLHRRRIYLNMVAGGFKGDLEALGDYTPHDERYERLVEYTLIIKELLSGDAPVTFDGRYYQLKNVRLTPPLPDELYPGFMISGSSEAGVAAAHAIQATAVRYPKPPGEEEELLAGRDDSIGYGMRVGIITRPTAEEAWAVALDRFPEDRKGQISHALAMKVSDSKWHEQLSALGERPLSDANPYWLGPFENYKTFCPYLVGDYGRVAEELSRYLALGFRTFILDVPFSPEDLEHTAIAFEAVLARVAA
jgi:alkanesulfonate monooxygenase